MPSHPVLQATPPCPALTHKEPLPAWQAWHVWSRRLLAGEPRRWLTENRSALSSVRMVHRTGPRMAVTPEGQGRALEQGQLRRSETFPLTPSRPWGGPDPHIWRILAGLWGGSGKAWVPHGIVVVFLGFS